LRIVGRRPRNRIGIVARNRCQVLPLAAGESFARLLPGRRRQPCHNINEDASLQTVLTTFETSPATCPDLMAELRAAYSEFISKQPGFVGAALHVNDARTRVANYSQWRNRDDFKDMLKTEEMRERNQRINALCRGFEPVMYEVFATHDA
jgi:quinol monooxygenase YgiN